MRILLILLGILCSGCVNPPEWDAPDVTGAEWVK